MRYIRRAANPRMVPAIPGDRVEHLPIGRLVVLRQGAGLLHDGVQLFEQPLVFRLVPRKQLAEGEVMRLGRVVLEVVHLVNVFTRLLPRRKVQREFPVRFPNAPDVTCTGKWRASELVVIGEEDLVLHVLVRVPEQRREVAPLQRPLTLLALEARHGHERRQQIDEPRRAVGFQRLGEQNGIGKYHWDADDLLIGRVVLLPQSAMRHCHLAMIGDPDDQRALCKSVRFHGVEDLHHMGIRQGGQIGIEARVKQRAVRLRKRPQIVQIGEELGLDRRLGRQVFLEGRR